MKNLTQEDSAGELFSKSLLKTVMRSTDILSLFFSTLPKESLK